MNVRTFFLTVQENRGRREVNRCNETDKVQFVSIFVKDTDTYHSTQILDIHIRQYAYIKKYYIEGTMMYGLITPDDV